MGQASAPKAECSALSCMQEYLQQSSSFEGADPAAATDPDGAPGACCSVERFYCNAPTCAARCPSNLADSNAALVINHHAARETQ
jgi:hypothetical protein